MYLDDTGAACTFLLNPGGGLVGGDEVAVNVRLHVDAHVIISTPSANRVYRSMGQASTQCVNLHVGPHAVLEWVPEVTIPFAGSRFRQTIRAQVDHGGILLLWDAFASGRVARDERWSFTSLENEISVTVDSGMSLVERSRVLPPARTQPAELAQAWNYVASFYMVGCGVPAEVWKRMETGMVALLDDRPGVILGGVSEPPVPGLVVKVLARQAPDLASTFEGLWSIARRELWNLPVPALRRY